LEPNADDRSFVVDGPERAIERVVNGLVQDRQREVVQYRLGGEEPTDECKCGCRVVSFCDGDVHAIGLEQGDPGCHRISQTDATTTPSLTCTLF